MADITCSVVAGPLPSPAHGLLFYGAPLEVVGIRIPFTEFQKEVLDHLLVAPLLLAPNGWGFLRGFEVIMKYLRIEATTRVFFLFLLCTESSREGSGTS